jgi:hypothetical protein
LALVDVAGGDGGVDLHVADHVGGDVADVGFERVRLGDEPVDTLDGHLVAAAGLTINVAGVREITEVFRDGLCGDPDRVGDFPLAHGGLSAGDLDEHPVARRCPLAPQQLGTAALVAHGPLFGRRV